MSRRPFWLAGWVLIVASGALAFGQTTGSIRGRVADLAGGGLAGVTIVVTSESAGQAPRGITSDSQGLFLIVGLPPGEGYSLKASLPNFATVNLTEIEVQRGQTTPLTLTLTPEKALQQQVRVHSRPDVVNLESTTTTTTISSEYLDALPILGRDYQDVLTLSPGVTDVDGDGNPNIHGARDTDVGTVVDGINTTDPLTGKIGMQLNIESIQEIEVKTSGATAEFGRAQGGFTNVLTKSGGNQFEGTLKFYWRGSALDGDGAGQDDPRLHGGLGEIGLRDLTFNDYLPFVSLGGPIVRDKAWFYVSVEGVHREEPVNAVSQAFISGTRETRAFVKATWQASPNNRLALVFNNDPLEQLNVGLTSLTQEETGYTVNSGGPMLSLRATSVLAPTVALETAASYMETRPSLAPNLGPDTNHDGALYADRNQNGFFEARERDPGEDYDGDGRFDVWEDSLVRNGMLDAKDFIFCFDAFGNYHAVPSSSFCVGQPDLVTLDEDGLRTPPGTANRYFVPPGDGDRHLTPPGGCEGVTREDTDCDSHLDDKNEDRNHNGILDVGEDLDSDGHLDPGTEDRNHNGILDDTPFPTSLYPYGHLTPTPADRDYTINLRNGLIGGPYFEDYEDTRSRGTLRQDLSVYVPDFQGTHDLKMGYLFEREGFDRNSDQQRVVAIDDPGYHTGNRHDEVLHPDIHYDCNPYLTVCQDPGVGRVTAILPVDTATQQEASGRSIGVYLQDTYKPLPNLSLGLGLRFDHEQLASSGYTYFDPLSESAHSFRLQALSGGEIGRDDLTLGNGDGVQSFGILADPLFFTEVDPKKAAAPWTDPMLRAAPTVFMQPRTQLQFASAALAATFPGIFQDGQVDPEKVKELGIPVQQAEWFPIENSNLSPRLSAAWDPAGTGRTKFFATWGRYYDRLFLSTVTGEQGLQSVERYYVYDRYGVSSPATASAGSPIPPAPDHGFGKLLTSAPPSVTQVSRDLKTPYSDELTLGFEREIAPEVALSVRYIRREYRDQLQDVDVNHEIRIDPVTGAPVDHLGLLSETTVNTPLGPTTEVNREPDGHPDLFVRNFFFNQVLRVGNFNQAAYHAIELEIRRRLSRRWQLQGSYVYSRAMGDAEDFQSRLGNDPSTLQSEFGYLDFDQRHVVKLNAAFYLPRDWQLAMASVWASGLPYSMVSRFFAHDNVDYQQFRTLYGFTTLDAGKATFVPLPRNTERNSSTLNLDLSARRNFVLGRSTWALMFDVFNVLNADSLHIQSVQSSLISGFDASSASQLIPQSQVDATRRFGRRFQVGFQVSF